MGPIGETDISLTNQLTVIIYNMVATSKSDKSDFD